MPGEPPCHHLRFSLNEALQCTENTVLLLPECSYNHLLELTATLVSCVSNMVDTRMVYCDPASAIPHESLVALLSGFPTSSSGFNWTTRASYAVSVQLDLLWLPFPPQNTPTSRYTPTFALNSHIHHQSLVRMYPIFGQKNSRLISTRIHSLGHHMGIPELSVHTFLLQLSTWFGR